MRRLPALLAAAVVARMVFHAAFLPAFEGPDEPFHLARAAAFASGSPAVGFQGDGVPERLVGTVRAYPCSVSLHRAFGCPVFGNGRAAFDLIGPPRPAVPAAALPNTESNQPPLFYAIIGALLRPFWPIPFDRLNLSTRLFSAGLVALAILGPLRSIARRRPESFALAGLLALLLPGAAEGLARSSNDAAMVLWAAWLVEAVDARRRSGLLVVLMAAGPLLKLTAFPVVAFAAAALWTERRRVAAVLGGLASGSVFLLQALRGWRWGGTLELNLPGALPTAPLDWALGLLRSAYTFVKTIFWVGEWTFFRAPKPLVLAFGLLLAAALVLSAPRRPPRRAFAHAVGAGVAAAGFLVFAIANRHYYGDWGGVGGWYFWSWAPWVAVAANDLLTMRPRPGRTWLAAAAVFTLVANLVWFVHALRIYG